MIPQRYVKKMKFVIVVAVEMILVAKITLQRPERECEREEEFGTKIGLHLGP